MLVKLKMEFIYLVNYDDFLVCVNFSNTKQISAVSIAHRECFQEEHPIYSICLEQLKIDKDALQTFSSPRMMQIMLSSWHSNGLRIGLGEFPNTKFLTQTQINKIIKVSELEIEFEKVRREINPNLPSRLACVYLAENNIEGRVMLQNMFHRKKNVGIFPVEIIYCDKFHCADSKWVEIFEMTGERSSIEQYWKGIESDNKPQYEYLVDGKIQLLNSEDQKTIFENFRVHQRELFNQNTCSI